MKLEDLQVGQPVEVLLGSSWVPGTVEAINPSNHVYAEGYVQVDVGFIWLGTPEKVRERK
jgi:hypothetical protein